MRILVASRLFAPEPAVAAQRLAALTRELVARGHEVEVLTSRLPRGIAAIEEPGVTVRRARVLRDRQQAVRGYLPYLSFDIPLFFRLLRARRPDAIVVEPPPTTGTAVRWAARIRRIPYLYYAADILSDAAAQAGASRPVVVAVRRMEALATRRAARVLAVSEGFAGRLRALGVAQERIEVIGNGADTRVFRPEGPAVPAEQPYALYAGTASESHGATIFVDAIARVDGLRLVVLGSGSQFDAIAARAGALAPGRVDMIPTVPPEEAARWLRGAVVALASSAPAAPGREAYGFFPAKLHAAAATGTPLLHVGKGSGAAFAAEAPLGEAVAYDPAVVADALQRRADAPAGAAEREEFAAWAAERVSLVAVARRAADVVEAVMGVRRPPHPPEHG